MEEEKKEQVAVRDKRRIKSAEDTLAETEEADLERLPTFVEKMMEQAEASDARLREYIAAHKERMAEIDKLRKRLEADVERRATMRFGDMVKDIFPCLDDFDRAMEQAAGERGSDPLLDGVRLMRDGLMRVLTACGLEVIDCLDKPFDPEVAQAVAMEPVEDQEKDNVVVGQLAPGYMFDGKVLRPALVRVGRKN